MTDPFFTQTHCDRCHKPLRSRMMSWFTTETICMDCSKLETELKQKLRAKGDHKDYEGCGYVPVA